MSSYWTEFERRKRRKQSLETFGLGVLFVAVSLFLGLAVFVSVNHEVLR